MDVFMARSLAGKMTTPERTEYLARAALVLYDMEQALRHQGSSCPLCGGALATGHSWQCEFSGALDTLDALRMKK